MYRLIWLPAIALAGCGSEDDQRPRSVEYVTQAILAPNCANAQCHSSFRKADGLSFGTVEEARQSLVGRLVGSITLVDGDGPRGEGASSFLFEVLTRTVDRMPYDQPLPEADIDLIVRWIDFGAPGAQCDPRASDTVCVGREVVECRPSYDYGAVLQDCAATNQICSAGACR